MSRENKTEPLSREEPIIIPFFDKETNTFTYLVSDQNTQACAIIDPVLNYDIYSGTINYNGADKIIRHINEKKLQVEWLIETHVHADHISASKYIQNILGGKIGISNQVKSVQKVFRNIFNLKSSEQCTEFDKYFSNGDQYFIGELNVDVIHTPGHTPACTTHVVGKNAFVGDTVFLPDSGTARTDFPGGDARMLFFSIQRILNLPIDTKIYVGHDYAPNGRSIKCQTSVQEQREKNIHVNVSISESQFIAIREARDRTLSLPKLMLPSIQLNMNAGELPKEEDNGIAYLKVPINTF